MTTEMELVVGADGGVRCPYDETLVLRELGKLQITRASHVEPDAEGFWWAVMRAGAGVVRDEGGGSGGGEGVVGGRWGVNGRDEQIAANRFSIPQDFIAILLQVFVRPVLSTCFEGLGPVR